MRQRFTRLPSMVAIAVAASATPLALPSTSQAQTPTTTQVMIRAVSHGAKIIGSEVGGARISVFDARTGELLARGMQEGGTGNSQKLVVEPRVRGEPIYDTEGAAGFLAELELDEPTQVRVEVEGPLGAPQASQRATRTMMLIPGQHVLGDGVIFDLYGFIIELIEPEEDLNSRIGENIEVRAKVTMLCGCPTEPGGLWDSSDFVIEGRIVQNGQVLVQAPLEFAGETSVYQGSLEVPDEEELTLQIVAMDSSGANFGLVERSFDETARGQSSQ